MTNKNLRSFFIVLTLIICAAGPVLAQISTAKVTGGTVEGVVKDGIASFKGIPFAAPPVGDLRWRSPQPVIPWQGVRKADSFAPSPMQETGLIAKMGGADHASEISYVFGNLRGFGGSSGPEDELPN
jgi:carboxylesterase type B